MNLRKLFVTAGLSAVCVAAAVTPASAATAGAPASAVGECIAVYNEEKGYYDYYCW